MSFTKITGPGISSYPVISGIITALNFKSGTTNVHSIGVEAAGINVLGGDTPIGTGSTIWKDGGALFSGIVTATSFVGNVSGGTVAGSTGTFSSDVTISGDLGVAGTLTYEDVARVDAIGLSTYREGLHIGPLAGIGLTAYKDGSIRTTGVITATTYYGSGAQLTGITGTTINNNANNKVITGSGSANTLEAEASLTFDAGLLKIDDLGGTAGKGRLEFGNSGEQYIEGYDTGNAGSSSYLTIGSNTNERLRIDSNGKVFIGSASDHGPSAYNLANAGLSITAAGENVLRVLDSTSYAADVGGAILIGGNYRSSGDTQPFVELKSFKENGTDNNYAYGFRIGTTPAGGSITERLRIKSTGEVKIIGNSTDNDFKNQNYPSESAGLLLQNWPSSNTTGAFVSNTYTVKAGNGTAQIGAWTAQSTATGTVPDMFYSVRDGNAQQHILRIGDGGDLARGMEISNNITLTGARNSNIISERLRILPSENDGYDDSHILSAAQTAGNWEEGAGASNYDTSWGWLWQYAASNNGTRQIRAGIAYDHKGTEEFKYWSSYGAHTWYVDGGKSGDETSETCDKKAQQINHYGSVINTSQPTYGIYTHGGVQTSNGGSRNVQYLEDCMGQWIVVAKIQQSSHLQSAMASVAQIDTSTGQATGTEWSASFGSTYPIAVRYVSSSDWKNWRDNRGVDFIQGVPHGRQWRHFFTNGASSGMTSATGGTGATKYGWTCDGAWDGKGRWHNPTFNWWRMSDPANYSADYVSASFFTSATAANASTALNLNFAGDAKFGVHAQNATGGQDYEVTSVYGYDDNAYGHEDNYPSAPQNNSGSDITAMPLWICLNVSSVGQFH